MSIKALLKKNKAVFRAAQAARTLPYPLLRGLCGLFRRACGIDRRTVYFSSFGGMLCNDNPRAVAEALHRLRPDLRFVFCLSGAGMRDRTLPDWIEAVPRRSLRALKALSTARVLVLNAAMQPWMRRFPGQRYVQTWHGDRGFKRIRLDVHPGRASYLREGAWIDLAVSGSAFGSRVFHSAMAVQGEILEEGCPRNDLLVARPPEVAARMRAALGIPDGARVLLYAPTFRNSSSGGAQDATFRLDAAREALERSTGERWVCLTRSHELARGIRAGGAKDVSGVADVSALLLAVDLLITDYSSIGGDFMLLDRPVIYFQPDRGSYDTERGLYFDPDESPLRVAHSEDELLALLSAPIDAAANCRACLAYFGARETGHASEAVARWIAERIDGD